MSSSWNSKGNFQNPKDIYNNKAIGVLLPHKIRMQYVHLRSQAEYFLLPWKTPEEISKSSQGSVQCYNLRQYLLY